MQTKSFIDRKRKNAFSLVEVIISIAILSFITVFLVTNMASGYKTLKESQKITKDNLKLMQEVEININRVRKDIVVDPLLDIAVLNAGTVAEQSVPAHTIDLFGQSITYFPVDLGIQVGDGVGAMHYISILGREIMPTLPSPTVMSLEIRNSTVVDQDLDTDGPRKKAERKWLRLQQNAVIYDDNLEIELHNADIDETGGTGSSILREVKYQWYVSTENVTARESYFYEDHGTGLSEAEQAMKEWIITEDHQYASHPSYPGDFVAIAGESYTKKPGETLNKLQVKREYINKQIILVGTPISMAGKMGNPFASNSIFITKPADQMNYGREMIAQFSAGLINVANYNAVTLEKPLIRWNAYRGDQEMEDRATNVRFIPAGGVEPLVRTAVFGYMEPRPGGDKLTVKGKKIVFDRGRKMELKPPTATDLDFPAFALSTGSDATIFMYVKDSSIGYSYYDSSYLKIKGDGASSPVISFTPEGLYADYIDSAKNYDITGGGRFSINHKEWKVIGFRIKADGAQVKITYFEDVGKAYRNISGAVPTDLIDYYSVTVPAHGININAIELGNLSANPDCVLDIAEVLFFDGALGDTEFVQLAKDLNTKYGLDHITP